MAMSGRGRLQWDGATLFRVEIKGEGHDDVDKMERTPLLNALRYASPDEVARWHPLVRTMLTTLESALKQSVEKWNEICGEDSDMHFTPTWMQQRGTMGRKLRATKPVNYDDKHDRFQLDRRLDSYNDNTQKKTKKPASKKAKCARKRQIRREESSEESVVSSVDTMRDRSRKKGRRRRSPVDLTHLESTSSEDPTDVDANDTSEEEVARRGSQKKTQMRLEISDDERPSSVETEEESDDEDVNGKETKKRKERGRKRKKKNKGKEEDDDEEEGSTASLSLTGVRNISSTTDDQPSSHQSEKARTHLKESPDLPRDDSGVLIVSGSTSKAAQRRKA